MADSIRAVRVHATGGPEALRVDSVPLAAPGPGEVRVRHTAIGVNFIDVYQRTGLYPLDALPATIGMEAAGVVEALGAEVEGVGLGDRVAYATAGPGAYAEARVLPARALVRLPDDVDDATAAAALLKGMTAEYLVRRCVRVERGMVAVVHAAAGGTGLLLCQWLVHLGAAVVAVVGHEAKAALVRARGVSRVVVRGRDDLHQAVRETGDGAGAHVVYDSVGQATFDASLDCLRPRGTMVSFGNASGRPRAVDPLELMRRGSLFLTRPTLFSYVSTPDELAASAAALFDVVRAGAVQVEVGRTFPLERAADAHRALEARETTASTLLLP